jgi:hypothetical protein
MQELAYLVVIDWLISTCSARNGLTRTSLFQRRGITSNLLGKLITTKLLHQSSTDIVLAVPFNLLGRSAVKYQSNGELSCQPHSHPEQTVTDLVVLPHFVGDEITVF